MSIAYSMQLPVDERALKNDARPFLITLFETGSELFPKAKKNLLFRECWTI